MFDLFWRSCYHRWSAECGTHNWVFQLCILCLGECLVWFNLFPQISMHVLEFLIPYIQEKHHEFPCWTCTLICIQFDFNDGHVVQCAILLIDSSSLIQVNLSFTPSARWGTNNRRGVEFPSPLHAKMKRREKNGTSKDIDSCKVGLKP